MRVRVLAERRETLTMLNDVYISDAIPTVHGESLVFRVEIGSRVYAFELDGAGGVCTDSSFIADTPGPYRDHERALAAARDCFVKCPNFLEVKKESCGQFRAVRTESWSGWVFKQLDETPRPHEAMAA